MSLLAIETTTAACSVALLCGGDLYVHHEVLPRQHAKLVLPWIDELLSQADCQLADLDVIAVGCGPGGFTGIRIGMAVAQGLAYGADLPVITASSLQVIAQSAYRHFSAKRVLVAEDARMQEVYWGAYELDHEGIMSPVLPDAVADPTKILLPEDTSGAWLAVGSAWHVYAEALNTRCQSLELEMQGDVYPHAGALVTIGEQYWQAGKAVSALEAQPVYLRSREALYSTR